MDQLTFIGYLVASVVTLSGFIAVIAKFTQPINDLRIVIQKLDDTINDMQKTDSIHDKRITEHGKQIDSLNTRVGVIETKINYYHGNN